MSRCGFGQVAFAGFTLHPLVLLFALSRTIDGESDSVSQTLIAAVPACQARKQGK